jgi:hypothetical protein
MDSECLWMHSSWARFGVRQDGMCHTILCHVPHIRRTHVIATATAMVWCMLLTHHVPVTMSNEHV